METASGPASVRIVGGLLGQWAVWTRAAVELLAEVRGVAANDDSGLSDLLACGARLTDANGAYQKTLWVAGKKAKYYKHLPGWARGGGTAAGQYDGVTGASVGSGETLTVSTDLADNLIDAGYQIRIDGWRCPPRCTHVRWNWI